MSLRSRVAERAKELLEYCRREGYNTRVALFVDLSRHSGRRRFVAWDMVRMVPIFTCPVSHGSGSEMSHVRSAYARFSNEDGSHLSSLGRAVVAERYEGRYGVAYIHSSKGGTRITVPMKTRKELLCPMAKIASSL